MSATAPHVAVLGGGIAGLAAAHTLLDAQPRPTVTLIEADRRLGGKVRSEPIGPEAIDVGAESLMARSPAAIELCEQLGLADELVPARELPTVLWSGGRLRPLPAGILGGTLPGGARSVLCARILSPAGLARAALDLALPACRWREDEAVGEIVRRRLGSQALERLIDPLLGTIYGADCDSLSARATAPQIDRLARERRSLIRGLLSAPPPRPGGGGGGPLFVSLPGGLERIVQRLSARMQGAAEVRLGVRAQSLARGGERRYLLELSDGGSLDLDGVVLATPSDRAAALLAEIAPMASVHLRSIERSSTVVVTLRCRRHAQTPPPAAAGLLVPAGQRRLLGACTFLSAKWPHLAHDGEMWLRCSVARGRVPEAMAAHDETLVARIAAELAEAIGPIGPVLDAHVTRWRDCLPVYRPGHLERVAHIDAEVSRLHGVELAGASYRGMGVPQCIAQGSEAARRVLAQLPHETGRGAPVAHLARQREGAA